MAGAKLHAFHCLRLFVFISLALALTGRSSEPLPAFLPSVKAVKDLVLPLGDNEGKPVLKFLCGRAQIERKSVGFLKVGILPQLVFEDVEVRIMNSRDSASWARELSEFFVSNPAISRALIKNVRICVSGRDEFVGAERANFDEKTQTLLLDNVDYQYSANEVVRSSRAVVHLQGPNAGRFSLAETPNRIIEISDEGFSPLAN